MYRYPHVPETTEPVRQVGSTENLVAAENELCQSSMMDLVACGFIYGTEIIHFEKMTS
jgi:hypothetical protein